MCENAGHEGVPAGAGLRREAENAAILALSAQGVAIKEIMRRTDKLRGLVC
jgi:hypothetical protein